MISNRDHLQDSRDTSLVKPWERLDDLQLEGLELIQDPGKFCFGGKRDHSDSPVREDKRKEIHRTGDTG